jgi:hypothetical protein
MDPQSLDSFDRGQLSIDWSSFQNDVSPTAIAAASSVKQEMYLDPSLLDSRAQLPPVSAFLLPDPGSDRPSEQRLRDHYHQDPISSVSGNSHGQDLAESVPLDFSEFLVDEMGRATPPPSDMNDGMAYHPPPMHLGAGTVDTFSMLGHQIVGEGQVPDPMSVFEGHNSLNLSPSLFADSRLVEMNQPSFNHGLPQRALRNSAPMTDNMSQLSVPGGRASEPPHPAGLSGGIQGDLPRKLGTTQYAMHFHCLKAHLFVFSHLRRTWWP